MPTRTDQQGLVEELVGRPAPKASTYRPGTNRPLDRVYPVLFIDAIMVKVRDGQQELV